MKTGTKRNKKGSNEEADRKKQNQTSNKTQ